MTNQQLCSQWKSYSLQLEGDPDPIRLSDLFVLCQGTTDLPGELGVIFDANLESGAPAKIYKTNEYNDCFEARYNNARKRFDFVKIGKFVRHL